MRITLYGKLGEAIGRAIFFEEMTGRTVSEVRRMLAKQYPGSAVDLLSSHVRPCVNDAIVCDDHPIGPGDELALLPPVSGG